MVEMAYGSTAMSSEVNKLTILIYVCFVKDNLLGVVAPHITRC